MKKQKQKKHLGSSLTYLCDSHYRVTSSTFKKKSVSNPKDTLLLAIMALDDKEEKLGHVNDTKIFIYITLIYNITLAQFLVIWAILLASAAAPKSTATKKVFSIPTLTN